MNKTRAGLLMLGAIAAFGATMVATAGEAEARRVVRAGPHVTTVRVVRPAYRPVRRVARGVAVGTAVGVAVGTSYRYSCFNLAYRCNRGEGWACIEHDSRCY